MIVGLQSKIINVPDKSFANYRLENIKIPLTNNRIFSAVNFANTPHEKPNKLTEKIQKEESGFLDSPVQISNPIPIELPHEKEELTPTNKKAPLLVEEKIENKMEVAIVIEVMDPANDDIVSSVGHLFGQVTKL